MQSVWKSVWMLHKILIEIAYDPAKSLLNKCTMSIATLFTIKRKYNQTTCPSTDKWLTKIFYLYTRVCYSTIKIILVMKLIRT